MENKILETIKNSDIQMKPRWHFILKAVLMMVGGVILLFLVVYLISFIIFIERQNGAGFIPAFGLRGWARFLITLPWLLILFSLLFIGVLELLVRRYAFAYRRPLLYSALGIIVIIGVSSIAVDSVEFHQRFSPVVYRVLVAPDADDINPGDITEMQETGFILTKIDGEILHVIVASSTRSPGNKKFGKGDRVVVFGDRESTSSINAFGIRKIRD